MRLSQCSPSVSGMVLGPWEASSRKETRYQSDAGSGGGGGGVRWLSEHLPCILPVLCGSPVMGPQPSLGPGDVVTRAQRWPGHSGSSMKPLQPVFSLRQSVNLGVPCSLSHLPGGFRHATVQSGLHRPALERGQLAGGPQSLGVPRVLLASGA